MLAEDVTELCVRVTTRSNFITVKRSSFSFKLLKEEKLHSSKYLS